MIPKKIHYCWFGRNPKPQLAQRCIASWKKYCPDYEIIEWNEDNFDVNRNGYTKMCYEQKKYAFLSDYVRLLVVHDHGGVYFDTDVEILGPIDDLLDHEAFWGFEDDAHVNTGIGFGCEAGHRVIRAMVAEYDFLLDGTQGTRGCPELNTAALVKLGLELDGKNQQVAGARILSADYMNPFNPATGVLQKTENTRSVHWYSAAWLSPWRRLRTRLMRPVHRIFGVDVFRRFRK